MVSLKKALFLCMLLSTSIAKSTTYYVATNGNDGNNGIEQTPWKTIQKAANTAKAGDHVYIKRGTYYNNVRIANSGTANNWIVFEAFPGDKHLAILEGGQIDILQKSYIRISGLKIQNANVITSYSIHYTKLYDIFARSTIKISLVIVRPKATGSSNFDS